MRNILESRISLDVLQSAVSEYVGCGEENLHRYFFSFWIYSMVDLAFLPRLHCAVEFFQDASVQHLENCHDCSSVKDLFERFRILAPLYPHSAFSIVPDLSPSNIFVNLVAQRDLAFSREKAKRISTASQIDCPTAGRRQRVFQTRFIPLRFTQSTRHFGVGFGPNIATRTRCQGPDHDMILSYSSPEAIFEAIAKS